MADSEDGSTERHAGLARAPTRWWRLVQATVMLALLVVALFATMGQTQLPAALNFAPEPTDAAQLTDAVVQPPTEPPARPKEPERPTEPPPPPPPAQPKKVSVAAPGGWVRTPPLDADAATGTTTTAAAAVAAAARERWWLRPGPASAAGLAALEAYLEASSYARLEALPNEVLCQRAFAVLRTPWRGWGNILNEVSNTVQYAIVTGRSVVYEAGAGHGPASEMPLRPSSAIASETSVRELLKRRGCMPGNEQTALVDLTRSHPAACATRVAQARFVSIYLQCHLLTSAFLRNCPNFMEASMVGEREAALLASPAFFGIVLVAVYDLDPVLRRGLARFVDRVNTRSSPRAAVDIAAHMRHRAVEFDVHAVECLAEIARRTAAARAPAPAPRSNFSIYLATDWPSTLPSLSARLQAEVPTVLSADSLFVWSWQDLATGSTAATAAADPELLAQLLAYNVTLWDDFAGHAKSSIEGWWGPTPSVFGLLEMIALASVGARLFVGSMCSTFTEVALGLQLFASPLPTWEAFDAEPRLYLMSRTGTCTALSAASFARAGIDYQGLYPPNVDCDNTPAMGGR